MILHIDMDAFYASIEIRDNPKLLGRPVLVGGSPSGRGVVAAASYEARKYGIHSAMSAANAIRLCPDAFFIKPRMEHYAQDSKRIREIFSRFTSLVEPLSLDEAFLDVTGSERLFGPAGEIAKQIKRTIFEETGLIASAGVAPNKYLAKVASDLEKPDGFVIVQLSKIEEFLKPLSIDRVWGIGNKTKNRFAAIGVHTIGELRKLPLTTLRGMFGVNAEHFWNLSRGIDSRAVVPDREAKTISHETTFHRDIYEPENLVAWIQHLTDQVVRRMRRHKILGRTIRLKLRYSNFQTLTRAITIAEPTCSTEIIRTNSEALLRNLETKNRGVRLLGVGVSNLSHNNNRQKNLFDADGKERDHRLDSAVDKIKDKFGVAAVKRATGLKYNIRHRPEPRVNDT